MNPRATQRHPCAAAAQSARAPAECANLRGTVAVTNAATGMAVAAILAIGGSLAAQTVVEVPVHQITKLHNSMANKLEGTGVVVGLNATGSGDKATRQALANFIRRYGVNIDDADLASGAAALVAVSAVLPPFSHEGMQLDVSVDGLGDATSLYGGRLVHTDLKGLDGVVYATAAGPVTVGGFGAAKGGTKVARNHTTAGFVPNGATVVQELPSQFLSEAGHLELRLLHPNEGTAVSIATGIGAALEGTGCRAGAVDRTLVRVELPRDKQTEEHALRIVALIRDVKVRVQNPSTVIIDEASGLVLAGEGVMISPCVVALADLTVTVVSEDVVSQPLPGINRGETAVVNRTRIELSTTDTELKPLQTGGASVSDLLTNLKALDLSPRQLIEVFQALSSGGYLHAELQVR